MQLFCCWGHCIIGPNWRSGFGSGLLILIPSAAYCWLVAPYLAGKVHVIILVVRWVLVLLLVLVVGRATARRARGSPAVSSTIRRVIMRTTHATFRTYRTLCRDSRLTRSWLLVQLHLSSSVRAVAQLHSLLGPRHPPQAGA
jgi:hypothetical protein